MRAAEVSWAVVANGNNRRVEYFAEAAWAAGGSVRVVEWRDVLREGGHEFGADEWVRLDSPGEDPEVDELLRDLTEPTRVEGTGRWYRRFLAAARSLRGGVRFDDPDELAVLFDKRLCHARLASAGVPVPLSPTSGAAAVVAGWRDVRALADAAGLRRFFVKLAHGSSASGVLALEWDGRDRFRATTSVERAVDGTLHNSLRLRRYTEEAEIAAVVDRLAPDGLHLERWIPKASQHGRAADLRVVVVDGRATHAVLRTSRAPMTNLHLGGRRGDLDAFRSEVGAHWESAVTICEQAAACFPGTLCVGVDLLPEIGGTRFAVGEVNAFGDLLPGLPGLSDGPAAGLDTYTAQVRAVMRRHGGAEPFTSAARPLAAR